MKRAALLLLVALSLALSACGAQKPEPTPNVAKWDSARWDSATWAR